MYRLIKYAFVMIPRLSAILSFIILSLTASVIYAQEPLPRESVLVSIDHNLYLPGDNILFSASVVAADDYSLSDLSKVLRVEITDSKGAPVVQEKYYLENSRVSQSLELPRGIHSGWYSLRAYTNWMRNFPADNFATINFRVVNMADIDSKIITDYPDTVIVELLPGPGGLVSNSDNEFAVRTTGINMIPCSASGYLLSSGDTISSFTTGNTGWSTIHFRPAQNNSYRFALSSPSNVYVISRIPTVESTGNHVSLVSSGGNIEAVLHSPGMADGSKVNLLVHSLYKWHAFKPAEINDGEARVSVPVESLPPGVSQFTFFDRENNIICEHLWISNNVFSEGSEVYVAKAGEGSSSLNTVSYRSDLAGGDGLYSVIIKKKEPSVPADFCFPGLPGWISDYSIPLDKNERKAWAIANSYSRDVPASFMPEGSSSPVSYTINFKDIPTVRESRVDFLPETRNLTLNGIIKEQGTGKPVYNEVLAVTALNDNSFYSSHTFTSGRFHFSLRGKSYKEDLILSYVTSPAGSWDLEVFPDFDPAPGPSRESKFSLTKDELSYIKDQALVNKLEAVYSPGKDSTAVQEEQEKNAGRIFYGYPDETVLIDKYIRLPNIREVLFELVPAVATRKKGDHYMIKVVSEKPFPSNYPTLVMVDGIPMIEYDKLLGLSPERFRKIDVVKSLYIHGNAIFAGIVNFISVNGDMAGLELPAGSKIISLRLPRKSKELSTTSHKEGPGFPVLSPLLGYKTFIHGGKGSFSFETGNNYGEYEVILSGFTSAGRYVKSSSTFEVKGNFTGN